MNVLPEAHEVNSDYIQRLIDNEYPEDQFVDYKRQLPSEEEEDTSKEKGNDKKLKARREFCKDVSSFANHRGGIIIYGIEEEEGAPTRIRGIGNVDPDSEIRKLDGWIVSNVEPTIQGFTMKVVALKGGEKVLVAHIPQSYVRPHAVKINKSPEFYVRRNGGKDPMTTDEIGNAFVNAQSLPQRIHDFRMSQIGNIVNLDVDFPFRKKRRR